ncbi:MAG: hypothetical protein DRO40_07900 [Thermoprotei archaeon]|nr:MAG: hypothetical protein DRO40_07900 [Thermoprotei archaeon]
MSESYFVVIKEYADGELKKLAKYNGEWRNNVLFDVVRKHRLYKGKWWIVEVYDEHVWIMGYNGRIYDVSDFVYIYTGRDVDKLVKMIQMAKEEG